MFVPDRLSWPTIVAASDESGVRCVCGCDGNAGNVLHVCSESSVQGQLAMANPRRKGSGHRIRQRSIGGSQEIIARAPSVTIRRNWASATVNDACSEWLQRCS